MLPRIQSSLTGAFRLQHPKRGFELLPAPGIAFGGAYLVRILNNRGVEIQVARKKDQNEAFRAATRGAEDESRRFSSLRNLHT